MYKKNVILLISSNAVKKETFINYLSNTLTFSYLKLEAIFETMLELYPNRATEQDYIKFFDHFVEKNIKNDQLCVIDINNCNLKNLEKLIENHENLICVFLDNSINIDNFIYVDIHNPQSVKEQINTIKMEVCS